MQLTRVVVKNHSRLAETDIEVRGHLILVGPNDVGKSSLLRCLDLLLGANTAQMYSRISADDFRDQAQPFIIEATIADLDADDQAAFPDEATVDPITNELTLKVSLEATIEDSNGTIAISRTAPNSGTSGKLSRLQIEQLGWNLLGATAMAVNCAKTAATRSMTSCSRSTSARRRPASRRSSAQIQDALKTSKVLDGIRGRPVRAAVQGAARRSGQGRAEVRDRRHGRRRRPRRRTPSPRTRRQGSRTSPSSPTACGPCTPSRCTTSSVSRREHGRGRRTRDPPSPDQPAQPRPAAQRRTEPEASRDPLARHRLRVPA